MYKEKEEKVAWPNYKALLTIGLLVGPVGPYLGS